MNRPDDWLYFAGLDLKAANAALRENIASIACFHSHQTAEKAIKALVLKQSGSVPKMHHLGELLSKAALASPGLKKLEDKVRFLNQFYVPTRYPDTLPGSLPEGLPSEETAQRAIELAQEVLDGVRSVLSPKA